jgi:F-type H+-transporting ATPase subunit delta
MNEGQSGKHYAKALFELLGKDSRRRQLLDNIDRISALLEDQTIEFYLADSQFSVEDKSKKILQMLGVDDPLLFKLVGVLIKKRQIKILPIISKEFQKLIDIDEGIENANVVSAVPLSEADKSELADRLAQLTGKKMSLRFSTNPSIIGGLTIRIGDDLFEGSTISTLEKLHKAIGG